MKVIMVDSIDLDVHQDEVKILLRSWTHHITRSTSGKLTKWNSKINIIKKKSQNSNWAQKLISKKTCFYSMKFKSWTKESIWWSQITQLWRCKTLRSTENWSIHWAWRSKSWPSFVSNSRSKKLNSSKRCLFLRSNLKLNRRTALNYNKYKIKGINSRRS